VIWIDRFWDVNLKSVQERVALVSLVREGRQRHGGELFRRVTPITYPLDQIKPSSSGIPRSLIRT
jgi:hypothetical protein